MKITKIKGFGLITSLFTTAMLASGCLPGVDPGNGLASEISAGGGHTCARGSNYVLECWGDGSVADTSTLSLMNIQSISSGAVHSCVLHDEGIECWGCADSNADFGQCDAPVLSNPSLVVSGAYHTCALDDSGVHCWGGNDPSVDFGQTVVPSLYQVSSVAAGKTHSCAIANGTVQCWGGSSGDLLSVPALSNPVKIVAGGLHSCVLDDTGVKCWGSGSGIAVPALSSVQDISAGYEHSCALTAAGIVCWGANDSGQADVPSNLGAASFLSAGDNHNCAINGSQRVQCWGSMNVVPTIHPSWAVETGVVIDASVETVWQVLTDIDSYPEWNEYSPSVVGDLVVGGIVTIQSHLGNAIEEVDNQVDVLDTNKKLCWHSLNWYSELAQGTRCRIIEPLDGGGVRFRHHEIMAGPVSGTIADLFKVDILAGLNLMNAGLKDRAESL